MPSSLIVGEPRMHGVTPPQVRPSLWRRTLRGVVSTMLVLAWSATASFAQLEVSASTQSVELDDQTRATSFLLVNPAGTATDVWLALDYPTKDDLLPYGFVHLLALPWHNLIPTGVLWLSGFPQHVVLQPHEHRTIPLQIVPYPTLQEGTYRTRVVYVQSPQVSVTPSGDTTDFNVDHGWIDVVYHKGTRETLLSLSALSVTRHPDGTARACVTVQPAGIGLIGQLHAEVQDSLGHPIGANVALGPGALQPWGLHEQLQVFMSTPVCFVLPPFASGHYRLLVEVWAMEDTAKHRAVRAQAPVVVP